MGKESKKQSKSLRNILLVLGGLLCVAAVLGGIFMLAQPGQAPEEKVTSKLYWNVDGKDYLKKTDLSSRVPGPDGNYTIRFAVDGEQVELKIRDRQMMNRIDHKDLMGLVFDEDGYIINFLEPEDCVAGEVGRMAYVTAVDGNTVQLNTSGTEDGLAFSIELNEQTGIYDVTGVDPVGHVTELQVNDRIRAFLNEEDRITHVFVLQREGVYIYDGQSEEGYCPHCQKDVGWFIWEKTDTLPNTSGHWRLSSDVKCKATTFIKQSNQVVLDLNGWTVTGADNNRVFWLDGNRKPFLAIMDQSEEGTGTIISKGLMDQGGIVLALQGDVEIYSGTLDASRVTTRICGAAIRVEPETTLKMYGGTIIGGTAKANMRADLLGVQGGFGGAVQVTGFAEFTMYDGVIRDGIAISMVDDAGWNIGGIGGNVHVQHGGVFRMEGGQILNGTADACGGNLYLESGSETESGGYASMLAGTISGGMCTSTTETGGNVWIGWQAVMDMTGGTIEKGRVLNCGGNVSLYGTLNMSGGTIQDGQCLSGASMETAKVNESIRGRNLFCVNGTLNMSGGHIKGYVDAFSTGKDDKGKIWQHAINLSNTAQIWGGENNLYVDPDEYIHLENLTEGAKICVTGQGFITEKTSKEFLKYVFADAKETDVTYRDERLYIGKIYCVCGQKEHFGACAGKQLEWFPWNDAYNLPDKAGNYYLTTDVTLEWVYYIAANSHVRLDLNGHKVTTSTNKFYNLTAFDGIELTITDTSAKQSGKMVIAGTHDGEHGMLVHVTRGNQVNLYAGTLDASGAKSATPYGAAITMTGDGTRFNMYGGTVLGGYTTGSGSAAGTVWMTDKSSFYLHGGKIIGGRTDGCGGNIFLTGSAQFVMRNGQIMDGSAAVGGNICLDSNSCVFIMDKGTVSGGKATCDGGNVMLNYGAVFHLNGGVITGGVADHGDSTDTNHCGGNVHCQGKFYMNGGTIEDGAIGVGGSMGGNVSLYSREAQFFMTDGVIRGGKCAKWGGDNVRIGGGPEDGAGSAVFVMTGGLIDGTGTGLSSVFLENAYAKLTLGGTAKLKGASNNVVFNSLDNRISIHADGFADGAEIWVSSDIGAILVNAGATEAMEAVFHLDGAGQNGPEILCRNGSLVVAYRKAEQEDTQGRYTVMSHNLLQGFIYENNYTAPAEGESFKIPLGRYQQLYAMLEANMPDVVAFQECDWLWHDDLLDNTTGKAESLGVHPVTALGYAYAAGDDKYIPNNRNPIYYNTAKLSIVADGWQAYNASEANSDTPWCITWAVFAPVGSNTPLFAVSSTHIVSNVTAADRAAMISWVVDFMKDVEAKYGVPVIMAGDYNTSPSSDVDYAAFQLGTKLLSSGSTAKVVTGRQYQTHNTIGYAPAESVNEVGVIDHIMISTSGIIAEKYENLIQLHSYSDHVPQKLTFRLDSTHAHKFADTAVADPTDPTIHLYTCECGMANRQSHSWDEATKACTGCGAQKPESTDKADCYCAGNGTAGHVCQNLTWTAWESADSLPYSTGNYYLTQDITVSGPCWPETGAVIRLDLNGHKISAASDKLFNLGVYGGVELTITDRTEEKTGIIQVSGNYRGELGMLMEIKQGNIVNLYAGTLDGGSLISDTCYGVTLTMTDGAVFNQYGGTIIGGTVTGGGGGTLWMASGTTFNMYGGILKDGKANEDGGNVLIEAGATFNLYDGTVSGGIASYNAAGTNYCCGGNFMVYGTLNMYGGVIENGTVGATGSMGGNVSVGYGIFNMSGGVVRGGKCALWGGSNVRVQSGTFHMTGGLVDGTGANDSSVFADGNPSNIVIGGTAKIQNAARNIVLNLASSFITLEDSLVLSGEDAAEIWVSAGEGRAIANNTKAQFASVICSDDSALEVYYDEETSSMKVRKK